jgi:hypothetical protein
MFIPIKAWNVVLLVEEGNIISIVNGDHLS